MSAASFLGISAMIAFNGDDGSTIPWAGWWPISRC